MRILIVDDQARKYQRLVEAVSQIGLGYDNLDFVTNAADARARLEGNKYDLMILDILLPLRPDTTPNDQNSVDLLVELSASDSMQKPTQIVGLTAHDDIATKVLPKFQEWLWTVIGYSDTDDGWVSQLLNCIRYLLESAKSPKATTHKVDLAIVCALHAPELSEVLRLPWNFAAPRPIDDVTFVHDGVFKSGGTTFSVAAVAASRVGMVSTALVSAKIIDLLRPRCLAMAGICAGVKGKTNPGDVLFVDPSWDWQSGKRSKDATNKRQFLLSPHQLNAPSKIRAHVEQLRGDRQALNNIAIGWGEDMPNQLRIVIGPVASGSAVLADGEVVEEIRDQHRELIGVEMEAYGLYAASHAASEPRPECFAMKAVCDFADPAKNDAFQRYAAYTSASCIRLLFERFGERLLRG